MKRIILFCVFANFDGILQSKENLISHRYPVGNGCILLTLDESDNLQESIHSIFKMSLDRIECWRIEFIKISYLGSNQPIRWVYVLGQFAAVQPTTVFLLCGVVKSNFLGWLYGEIIRMKDSAHDLKRHKFIENCSLFPMYHSLFTILPWEGNPP